MSDLTTENPIQVTEHLTADSSPAETTSTEATEEKNQETVTTAETQTEGKVETAEPTTETVEVPDIEALKAERDAAIKKADDFKKGMDKWRGVAKDLKSQVASPRTTSTKPVEEMTDWERMESLMDSKLAHLMGVSEQQERQSVIDEIAELPYTKELGPEIKANMDEFDADEHLKTMPFKRKLEMARSKAIADNAHLIAEISEGRGINRAYEHQTVKKTDASGSGGRSNATVVQEVGNILDRVKTMSREEFIANRAEIDKAMKESMGI